MILSFSRCTEAPHSVCSNAAKLSYLHCSPFYSVSSCTYSVSPYMYSVVSLILHILSFLFVFVLCPAMLYIINLILFYPVILFSFSLILYIFSLILIIFSLTVCMVSSSSYILNIILFRLSQLVFIRFTNWYLNSSFINSDSSYLCPDILKCSVSSFFSHQFLRKKPSGTD